MRIAYFTNQYPKVSHSFIRREIQALEALGQPVVRFAVRGWDDPLVDPRDIDERARTTYLLGQGLAGLFPAMLRILMTRPAAWIKALRMASHLTQMSDKGFAYHLVYLAEACRLALLCQSEGIDRLHAHFGTNAAEVAMLCRMVGGPTYSFTVHGPEEFDRPLGLHLAEKIDHAAHVVAISSFGRSQLYRWIDHGQWKKVRVVHCGLEASFLAPAEITPPPDEPRFVCVGRLCEQKGQFLLLEAVRQLRDRGIRLKLVLAGDGEMRGVLEQFIDTHRLGDQVHITGWISSDAVKDALINSRIMVLPSFAEGLPVVIMEAMALGRPVITTSIAGIPELVRQGVDGWLVPAGDVHALADAMEQASALSAADLTAMGTRAQARVRERHDANVEAGKLLRMFEECL